MKHTILTIIFTLIVTYFLIVLYGKYRGPSDDVDIIEINKLSENAYVIIASDKNGNDRFFLANQSTVLELVDANNLATSKIIMSIKLENSK